MAQMSAEPASCLPDWYSRIPNLETLACISVSKNIAPKLRESTPNQVWKSPYWRKEKENLKYLPRDIRVSLLNTTRTFLMKLGCDDGRSLFTCWWILFNEKSDKSIDVKHSDIFDGKFFVELIDYLGSVRTKVVSTCLSYNWLLHSNFQKMVQQQPQLKHIKFYHKVRPEALMCIAEGLELESVTFDISCGNQCKTGDLTNFIIAQQKTLVAFRWRQCFFTELFPDYEQRNLLLDKLQVLEVDSFDLFRIPRGACKSIVKLEVNIYDEEDSRDPGKRMGSLKELKISFLGIRASVDVGFCAIFENQSNVGPLYMEIVAHNVAMPQFVLSHIPNVHAVSVTIFKNTDLPLPPPHLPALPPQMTLLKVLKGTCTTYLFRSLQNCPNLERLELKVQGPQCVELCKRELTRILDNKQKLNLQLVDIIIDSNYSKVSFKFFSETFNQLEICCPFLRVLTFQQTICQNLFYIKAVNTLIRRLTPRGFMLELSRVGVPNVEIYKSPFVFLPVCFTISRLR